MENIRIEEIGNTNETYHHLEKLLNGDKECFLYIGISDDRKLFFEIPSSLKKDISLTI